MPWPKELEYLASNSEFVHIRRDSFFVTRDKSLSTCVILSKAIFRYLNSSFFDDVKLPAQEKPKEDDNLGQLTKLNIASLGHGFKCEYFPSERMDESYSIKIEADTEPTATIAANSSWGVLRALETFSQLIYSLDEFDAQNYAVRPVSINDEPRFGFRGYMLDTSRHYISVDKIKQLLDAMAFNKLNVFHWHFSDDQSFPLVSKTFPQLSRLTSYRRHWTYNSSQVSDIIQYAADRGIRVMPELDSPGHTYSLRSIPSLLAKCYNKSSGQPTGDFGPVDPTNSSSYQIIGSLVKELHSTFRESYFHAGGDEVDYDCWRSNPDITKWMKNRNIEGNYRELSNIYMRRIYDLLSHYGKTMLVWQEVFDANASMPDDTIIHIWKYLGDRPAYMEELKRVVEAGYRAILSSCWYLNYIDYGQDWVKFYQCDPADSQFIKPAHKKKVLGGEICMWSEFVDDTNVITRTWPRASAAAERLWSPVDVKDTRNFLHRLEQIRCRMFFRGIHAEPVNGPGFC